MIRPSAVICALLSLCGCASNVPPAIRSAPEISALPSAVQRDPARYVGRHLRWGGTIIGVQNLPRTTEIEILARPLHGNGEPRADAPGEGRFIARATGFLDPAELPADRLLTVAGRLQGVETRLVGEYPYPFPILEAEVRYLWPEPLPPEPYPYPWYDPWFSPWYRPWGPWWGPW